MSQRCLQLLCCIQKYCSKVRDGNGKSIHSGNIAIFYTVWSTRKGAGREIIFNIVDYLKEHKPNVKRYVTLSPKTEMAFISETTEWIGENETTNNFEYFV